MLIHTSSVGTSDHCDPTVCYSTVFFCHPPLALVKWEKVKIKTAFIGMWQLTYKPYVNLQILVKYKHKKRKNFLTC